MQAFHDAIILLAPASSKNFKNDAIDTVREFGERVEEAMVYMYKLDLMRVNEASILKKLRSFIGKIREFTEKNE